MQRFGKLAAAGMIAIGAIACTGTSTEAMAQTSKAAPAPDALADDSSTLSCADFNAAAAQVTPAKNATAAQKRTAVDAQDYIGTGMVWLHGYLTGRKGAEVGKLTREWVEVNVAKLGKECAAATDPTHTLLVDLIVKP